MWWCSITEGDCVPGAAGFLALSLEGRDAFSNACSISAAQVQITCQPDNALHHVEVQAGSADGAVSINANAVAQGECCAVSCQMSGPVHPQQLALQSIDQI